MDTDSTILLIVTIAALTGTFLTVVPVLPGTLAIPLGAIGCALVIGWGEFPLWFWMLQGVLVAAYLIVDNVAQVLGVRRVGGSKSAMVGGAIGVFAGPLVLALVLGPLALFIGPPLGAVIGTLLGEARSRRRATDDLTGGASRPDYVRLGMIALVAFLVSTGAKLSLIAVQVLVLVLVVR